MAVHLALEHLEAIDLALGLAVASGRTEGRVDGGAIASESGGERADLLEAAHVGTFEPGDQARRIARPHQRFKVDDELLDLADGCLGVKERGAVGALFGCQGPLLA